MLLGIIAAAASSLQFAVPSKADAKLIYGQIDKPAAEPKAIVMLVQGTGVHNRNYNQRNPGAPLNFVFLDLGRRLNAAGLSVVRSDKRGASCVQPGAPKPNQNGSCYWEQEALTTTTDTYSGDFEAVAERAAKEPEGRCVIVMAHSEGGWHMSRSIGEGRLRPFGYIGLATPLTAWPDYSGYSTGYMLIQALRKADRNGDGVTTHPEVARHASSSPAIRSVAADGTIETYSGPQPLRTPKGGWTVASLKALEQTMKAEALISHDEFMAKSAELPVRVGAVAYGRIKYRRAMATDWTPTAHRLRRFRGPITFHQGLRDPFSDVEGSKRMLERHGPPQAVYRTYPGLNHTFGNGGGISSKMSDHAATAIVADAVAMADSCNAMR